MHQLVVFNGTVLPSDTANTASSAVERDPNCDSLFAGVAIATPGTALPAAAPTAGAFFSLIGSLLFGADSQTGAVTLTALNKFLQKLSASGGAYNVTLPPASTSANLVYWFLKTDSSANVPTIKGAGTDNITAGGATANTYAGLTAQGSHVLIWCDGTQWWQLA